MKKSRNGWKKSLVSADDKARVGRLLAAGMGRKDIAEVLGITRNRVDYIRNLLRPPEPIPEPTPEPTPEPIPAAALINEHTGIRARGPKGPKVSFAERATYERLYVGGATRGEIALLMSLPSSRIDIIRRSVKAHNKGQLPALETRTTPEPAPIVAEESRRRQIAQGAEIAEAALMRVAETFALAATQMRKAATSTRDWTDRGN